MSTEVQKAIALQFYAQGATGQWDDDLLADDILYHGPQAFGDIRGRDGFKQLLGAFRSAFPGFETTVEDVVAAGDCVVVRHTHHAVHKGEFNGIAPTGRHIVVPGIEMLRVRDGRIAEFWHLDDFLGLLQQLGAVPEQAGQ